MEAQEHGLNLRKLISLKSLLVSTHTYQVQSLPRKVTHKLEKYIIHSPMAP